MEQKYFCEAICCSAALKITSIVGKIAIECVLNIPPLDLILTPCNPHTYPTPLTAILTQSSHPVTYPGILFGGGGVFNKFSWRQRAAVAPSQGFRSICKWVKPVFSLGCYGCISTELRTRLSFVETSEFPGGLNPLHLDMPMKTSVTLRRQPGIMHLTTYILPIKFSTVFRTSYGWRTCIPTHSNCCPLAWPASVSTPYCRLFPTPWLICVSCRHDEECNQLSSRSQFLCDLRNAKKCIKHPGEYACFRASATMYRIFPSITRTLCITRTPYFSVLTNLLYRYRAPGNTWNTWPGPYLGILRPWVQENVPPPLLICSYSVMCK
jgi:hypothetical protein